MNDFLKQSWHFLAGLGTIGAVAGLVASGHVDGQSGLAVITGVGGALIGGGIANVATTVSTTPKP